MRVIVVGVGKIGKEFVKEISKEGVDIVVIDKKETAVNEVTDAIDCNGYVGNGTSIELLKKAGIESATLFVALTKSDETNVLCCQIAKQFGVKRTIASIRQFSDADLEYFKDKLGVDLIVNPDKTAAIEVSKLIKYAADVEIERVGEGEASVASVFINKNSILAGVKMPAIQSVLGVQALVCAIEREGKIIVPEGKHGIEAGDRVSFVAIGKNMDAIMEKLMVTKKEVKHAVIVGAGKVGFFFAKMLIEKGKKVTIIDKNAERCNAILEEIPKANVLCGDGTDTAFMEKELKGVDACVIMTGRDEENLIISMFAKSAGLELIAAEIDNENYEKMLRKSGINHVFSTRNAATASMVKDLRLLVAEEDENDNNVIKWLYNINHGKVEAVEFELTEEFPLLGIPFKNKEFNIKNGIRIVVIIRDGEVIIPDGNSFLKAGDQIILVSAGRKISKLTEIIA